MNPFNLGDVVRLKSGGPEMTVSEAFAGSVSVVWFQENPGAAYISPASWGDLKTRMVPVGALELVRR